MIKTIKVKKPKDTHVKGVRLFFGYIGLFLILVGFILLFPLIILAFYPKETAEYHLFLGPSLLCFIIGATLFFTLIFKRPKARLERWQSYLLLISVWIISIFAASLPYLISGEFNFTQAIFEATSGFTTTAITLLDNPAQECSHVFLFYRVWLLFVGGIGLTLILTSAISDSNGLSIYNLEGHNDRLLPNLIKSARIIFLIYTIYICIGVAAYVICGMPVFDAVCNSISSLSTGGFMNVKEGIGSYHSISIEIVTIVLMLLGSTNFVIHFAIIRGKFKKMFYHCEFFCWIIMFILFVPVLTTGYTTAIHNNFGEGFRHAVFNFVSMTTSSGFILGDVKDLYSSLPSYMFISAIICMIVGGQAGSTSGGIKQMRVVQIVKQIFWQIRSLIDSPHVIHSHTIIKYGKKEAVEKDEFSLSTTYLLIFVAIILICTFALTCFGEDFQDCFFEMTSLITTTGFSCGIMCYGAPLGVLWIGTIGMLIGRLEPLIFIMLIAKGSKTINESIKYKMIEKQLND